MVDVHHIVGSGAECCWTANLALEELGQPEVGWMSPVPVNALDCSLSC